ncbi:MAG: 3-dehydroquinate synthase [Nitrospirae bacterium]|nr:3-dehydroquinate synthase [Nitrospirota bacterium]
MTTVRVELGSRSYPITIGSGILTDVGERLTQLGISSSIALVSNTTVFPLYGAAVARSLSAAGLSCAEIILPDGEEHKTMASAERIFDAMLRARLDRTSVRVALGGGVIGDLAGFAASVYMRGIDFIQIPTTLLAQVDSSVGGKTGVNHPLGKNMLGTFWQPRLVWIDVDTLLTLPRREFIAGVAEIIKYGIIWDRELFDFLETQVQNVLDLDSGPIRHIIRRSCEIKADVVARDEREGGLRAILNFGHTIGHALETATGYTSFLHGEAVAVGMCAEAELARLLGIIGAEEVLRVRRLVGAYGLPSAIPGDIDLDLFFHSMKLDKKAVSGALRFILPDRIGNVTIHRAIPESLIRRAVEQAMTA